MVRRLSRVWVGVLAAVLAAPAVYAQGSGRIVGRVVEAGQGAPLAGATVEVTGSALKATTALDGRYTLQNVPEGTVSLTVRMIGFQPKTVTGLVVAAGRVVEQNISLSSQVVQLQELTVGADAERGSVNRALDEQRNATGIVNAITAEQIEKSPDSDAGQAIQRVSGVSVQDGKYVFVRGLGERYTTTSLNGSRIPSPEPERRVVPLDLFPSGLLEAITTSKTFTPDQPGDFSGGQVNLKTREFNTGRVLSFSASSSFNTSATFKDVTAAPTAGGEWLAFGGSNRALPGDIAAAGNLSGITTSRMNQFIGQFRNSWSAERNRAAPNGGFSVALGGEDPIGKQLFNYLASFNYGNSQEIRTGEVRGLATCDGAAGATGCPTQPFNQYTGETGRRSVLWGALANVGTRLGSHTKLAFNNTFTRSADNEASVLQGENEEFVQFNPLFLTRLTYTERSIRSNQVTGEHLLGERSFIDWSVTNSGVRRNEPDRSDIAYTAASVNGTVTPTLWPGAPRFATRTFTDLNETSWNASGAYRLTIGDFANPVQVKVGGAYRYTDRDADSRAYDILNQTLTDAQRSATPEQVFSASNVNSNSFFLFANANAGRYTASEYITAGFGMVEVPLGRRVKVVGGARVERWDLAVNTTTVTGQQIRSRPVKNDLLPSLAVNIALTDNQNLRFSGSQTLSRPEYRELSPVPYFEQIGLLTTIGNPDLNRALIQNLDARWEWYPKPGEVISLGAFYKNFDDPIEKVIVLQAGASALSFVNADRARNYGAEVEVRKMVGAGKDGLSPFTLFANTTLMSSDITPGNTGISALTRSNRPMVGQSRYVVNGGITFAPNGGGFNLTALYNVAGRRILEAGAGGLPDAYEEARHLVDVSMSLPIGSTASLKVDAKNLLNAPYRLTQGETIRQRFQLGRIIGFGVAWRP